MTKRFIISLLIFIISTAIIYAQVDPSRLCSSAKIRQFENTQDFNYRGSHLQTSYDVNYYELELDLYPETKTILGKVSIDLTILSDSARTIEFDLSNHLNISSLSGKEGPLTYFHQNDKIAVDLGSYLYGGEKATILINYNGTPQTGSFNFDTRNGHPMIWSLSQPFGARDWWPCKDVPADKADSARISLTVPDGIIAASNGTLIEEFSNGGRRSFVWKEKYPITTYLISVAAHPYVVEQEKFPHGESDTMDILHFIFPDHYENVVEDYRITTEMLSLFSDLFGPYPFLDEKYGHAEFPWGGGMEHQTISSMLGPYEYLIAHELAHQWWGDMITCEDFHHIWLNEGFATYAEALWAEHKYGKEAYSNRMESNAWLGEGSIYVPDLSDEGRIFSGALSYDKASWVLHMLRHVIGDEAFFRVLKSYGSSSKRYGVATTEFFREICENETAMNLEKFFDQWVYKSGHPIYAYEYSSEENEGRYKLELTIAQDQAYPVFKMPLDLLFLFEDRDSLIVVQNNELVQRYTFEFEREIKEIIIDPENWVLKETRKGINMIHHNNNKLLVSLSDLGSIGFDQPNGSGVGLVYPKEGKNHMYYGSILLTDNDGSILDNDLNTGDSDFSRKEGTELLIRTIDDVTQEGEVNYVSKEGSVIEIRQRSYTMNTAGLDNVIFINYVIINEGQDSLKNNRFGLFLDPDIGYYLDNKVEKEEKQQLIYQSNGIFLGLKALNLNNSHNLIAIKNAIDVFTDDTKNAYLNGQLDDYNQSEKADWSVLLVQNIDFLAPGDSIAFDFAILAAESKDSLLLTAEKSQDFFDLYSAVIDTETQFFKSSFAPNPTSSSGILSFSAKESNPVQIELFNNSGELIWVNTLKTTEAGSLKHRIDLSGQETGIYILKISQDGRSELLRIVRVQ